MFGIRDERGYNQVFRKRGTTVLRAHRRNDWFAHQLEQAGAKHAIEIGSGTGQTAYHVARSTGIDILAVDLSQQFIDEAKVAFPLPNLEFRALNILDASAELSARTDAFFGNGILHHLIPGLDQVLQRMRALTRDGGTMAFIEPNLEHPACRMIFGTGAGSQVGQT